MVNVQRQASVAPARDETALDIFRHQWELYRKFLTHDYLENAGAYAELHRFLNDNVARPFAFVDLACGDASGIVTALKGTADRQSTAASISRRRHWSSRSATSPRCRARSSSMKPISAGDAAVCGSGGHRLDQPVAAPPDTARQAHFDARDPRAAVDRTGRF